MWTRLSNISFILLLFLPAEPTLAEAVFPTLGVELKGQIYQLEIASNSYQRSRGLMYRRSLDRHAGMLFIHPAEGHYDIWMKNTLIPLTVIWLDSEARIIAIKTLPPCQSPTCPVYSAGQASRYILELHASQAERFKPGDTLPAIQLEHLPGSR